MAQSHIIETFKHRALNNENFDAVLDAGAPKRVNDYYNYISCAWVKNWMKPQKKDRVLDIGCGLGRLTHFLSPYVLSITGVDPSKELLDIAMLNRRHNETFVLSESTLPPLNERSFEKILSNWVFMHLQDNEIINILISLNNYCTSEARFYLFEQCNLSFKAQPTDIHIHRTVNDYIQLFSKAGWQCIKQKRVWRMPSYGLGYWNRFNKAPAFLLPLFIELDCKTLYRHSDRIDYTTEGFIFIKK